MKKDIKENLIDIPLKPGVYLMKDNLGDIIYIGKAKLLKNRVRSYFLDGNNTTIKTRALVEHVQKIDWVVTDSENEAFALESNLIKQFKPRYNILLKDDKHFPYIKVDVQNDYPRIEVVRRVLRDGAKYFGPYFDSTSMRKMLEVINKTYKVRTCKKNISKIKGIERPCLNYDIGKCIGACRKEVTKEMYRELIDEALEVLSGNTDKIIATLIKEMNIASDEMNFEEAAELRDRIQGLNVSANQGQRVISTTIEPFDVFAVFHDEIHAIVQVLISRSGKIIGSESFLLDMKEGGEANEILAYFLQNYYMQNNIIPKDIYTSDDIDGKETMVQYLQEIRQGKVSINTPVKGRKRKLIDMAIENAKVSLNRTNQDQKRKWEKTGGAVLSLKEELKLEKLPNRIEGFDISNIQGVDTVASMVVFKDGIPSRKEYRRFKIKTVDGPDDFKSMAEVISRRFNHAKKDIEEGKVSGFSTLPDLVLIDGGKGQLSAAKKIIDELGFNDISMIGLAKREEEVFLTNNKVPILINKRAPALHLLQRIRDEAHRFAITYHRTLRKKRTYKSVLDDIKGIGVKRKNVLLIAFPTISAIKNAKIEELVKVDGISHHTASLVFNHFNSSNEDKDSV
ncbi:MAG: excinuclease ABC subunit UvrC [Clostridiales bacterium]|nr:excinuclease ABC subunit UvrC [Clostridiales bacterium]